MSVGAGVVVHPSLWATALRQWRRLTPTGWWRRRPFLPLPSRAYLRFRLLTHTGESKGIPDRTDVLHYLRWCRQQHDLRGDPG
ncbi:MAG: hypothetical protein ACK5OX_18540 [Desertimonas sp.]